MIADTTRCVTKECPDRENCQRSRYGESEVDFHSYASFGPDTDSGHCGYYIEREKK